jgi:hypothetical protein
MSNDLGSGMRFSVSIPMLVTLLLNACQPIVVRVGKRSSEMEAGPLLPAPATVDVETIKNWNSVEDFLLHLDEIRNLGREALIKRYHEDGRQQIRLVFRRFRDAVEGQAEREGLAPLPYLSSLAAGTCVPISTQDIFGLEAFGDLKALLETTFLSRIQPSEALPDPAVPGSMDAITKLGFFELGIAMDGQSFYEESPQRDRQGTDLRWKVIHEQNEPEDWALGDDRGVQFRFLKTQEAERTLFTLDAQVGAQLYEKASRASLPGLWIDFEKIVTAAGASTQTLLMQSGWREPDGRWQKLQLSRRFVMTQDIAQGHILHVAASEQWGKANAIQKKFRIDLDARSLCSELGGS